MFVQSLSGDVSKGAIRGLASINLSKAPLNLALEAFKFHSHKLVVVFLCCHHECRSSISANGDGPGASGIKNVAELLLCSICSEGFPMVIIEFNPD